MNLRLPRFRLPGRADLERGVTAVEYAILVAVIGVVSIPAIAFAGSNLSGLLGGVSSVVASPGTVAPGDEEQWDDLSSFTCTFSDYDEFGSMMGSLSNSSNFAFAEHAGTDPDELAAIDKVVTLSDPDAIKRWLACGGKPTMRYQHSYQLRFHLKVTYGPYDWGDGDVDPGYVNEFDHTADVHTLTYAMSEPKVKGNQLVFTKGVAIPSDWPGNWWDPTLDDEIRSLVDGYQDPRVLDVQVTLVGKEWDEYRWQTDFYDHWGEPYPAAELARFQIADGDPFQTGAGGVQYSPGRIYS